MLRKRAPAALTTSDSTCCRETSALLQAITAGELAKAQGLILLGVALDGADAQGNTALHLAAARGATGIVRLLLERKGDLHATSASDLNALQVASSHGYSIVAKILIGFKAELPDAHLTDGLLTPLSRRPASSPSSHRAGQPSSPSSRRAGQPSSPSSRRGAEPSQAVDECRDVLVMEQNCIELLAAIHSGDPFRAQGFASAGAALDSKRDHDGRTALHLATMNGWAGLVRMLLEKKANVDARAAYSSATALHLAVCHGGHFAVIALLLEALATPDLANASGETPLGLCIFRGCLAIVRRLVEAKADTCPPLGTAEPTNVGLESPSVTTTSAAFGHSPSQGEADKEAILNFFSTGQTANSTDGSGSGLALLDRADHDIARLLLEKDNRAKRTPVRVDAQSLLSSSVLGSLASTRDTAPESPLWVRGWSAKLDPPFTTPASPSSPLSISSPSCRGRRRPVYTSAQDVGLGRVAPRAAAQLMTRCSSSPSTLTVTLACPQPIITRLPPLAHSAAASKSLTS